MIISKCKKSLDTKFGQCKTQTADCRLQTGGKMQAEVII